MVGGSSFFWLGVPVGDLVYVFGLFRVWPILAVMFGGLISFVLLYYLFRDKKSLHLSDYWFSIWFIPNLRTRVV